MTARTARLFQGRGWWFKVSNKKEKRRARHVYVIGSRGEYVYRYIHMSLALLSRTRTKREYRGREGEMDRSLGLVTTCLTRGMHLLQRTVPRWSPRCSSLAKERTGPPVRRQRYITVRRETLPMIRYNEWKRMTIHSARVESFGTFIVEFLVARIIVTRTRENNL